MEPTGILLASESLERDALLRFARAVEELGFESLWLPELFGREPFTTAAWLLGATSRIRLGTAIANVYARDPVVMAQARHTLAELSDGRFLLGLGVSNRDLNALRGHTWEPPVKKMRGYVDAMDEARVTAPEPAEAAPLYLAAHAPGLQRLAAERADGILTYLMTPEHTRAARETLGADGTLNAVTMCMLEPDPETARSAARKAIGMYVGLDYYRRVWTQLGFEPGDFEDGGSDRLVDAIVAWGDAEQVKTRLEAFREAGADRVLVVPLNARRGERTPDHALLEALAG